MDADLAYKNNIGQRMTELLLNAYQTGALTREQVAQIAGYIREDFIEKDHDSASIFTFLETLAAEWPIFSSLIYNRPAPEQTFTQSPDETAQIEHLQTMLKEEPENSQQS